MRNTSGIAKFFIVCAVVFGVGLLCTVVGAATGGIDDFGKVAEKREWIQDGPGKQVKEYVEVGDFDSVEIKGCADVNFVTRKWSAEEGETEGFAPGKVLVIRGSKVKAPEIKTEKGVLYIESPDTEFEGISISLSGVARTPGIFVYCTDEQLKSIKAKSTSGDLSFMGISFKKADITSTSGDIFIKDVRGGKLDIKDISGDIVASGKFEGPAAIDSGSGDVRLSGKFLGETKADIKSGDFSYTTKLAMDKYAVDVSTLSGDIRVVRGGNTVETVESDDASNNLSLKGGPNSITVQLLEGDAELTFGK